jgi:uncharacterized protein with GYD domain
MTKILIKASYTPGGVKGVLKEGGTGRKNAVEKMIRDLGGKVEAFYYAFGEYDIYSICELPDASAVAAITMTINATGLVSVSTTVLLGPEEIDKATKLAVNYRSPGG